MYLIFIIKVKMKNLLSSLLTNVAKQPNTVQTTMGT